MSPGPGFFSTMISPRSFSTCGLGNAIALSSSLLMIKGINKAFALELARADHCTRYVTPFLYQCPLVMADPRPQRSLPRQVPFGASPPRRARPAPEPAHRGCPGAQTARGPARRACAPRLRRRRRGGDGLGLRAPWPVHYGPPPLAGSRARAPGARQPRSDPRGQGTRRGTGGPPPRGGGSRPRGWWRGPLRRSCALAADPFGAGRLLLAARETPRPCSAGVRG